jgi:hypothetical protein
MDFGTNSEIDTETNQKQRIKQKRLGSKRAPPLSRVGEREIGKQSTRMRQQLTNGTTALARWIGKRSSRMAKCKVLAPLLSARAIDDQFDTGASQRRCA